MTRHFILVGICLLLCLPSGTLLAEDEPLIMGVFPRRNAEQTIRAFSPLARHLSEVLHRQVKLETASSFGAFWQGVSTLRYDIVHYNQYHYIRSHRTLGYTVFAMNEEFGSSTITGAIAVRIDSGIKSLSELKGRKIVFGGGPKAMMSYIVPTHLLREAGLNKGDYQEDFARNPPNAVMAVYYDQAVAAGVGNAVMQLPGVKSKCDMTKLRLLVESEAIAHLPWAAKDTLSGELLGKIQTAFITLKDTPKGLQILKRAKLTGLLPAKDTDYDKHRSIIENVTGTRY